MAIVWITDPHLDHAHARVPGAAKTFGEMVRANHDPEAVIITGDIAEGHSIERLLKQFAEGIGADRKVFWLEGNHDHYGASIRKMQGRFRRLNKIPNLVWLDTADPVLFDDFALVGKFAWYDGLNGNPQSTQIVIHDFEGIEEFACVFNEFEWVYWARRGSRTPLLKIFRKLAKDAVAQARPKLEEALQLKRHVIFATHVAPFEGAAWHEGKPSNPDWQPWFSCRQMGDMLEEVAALHPDHKILVLCGHSHSPGQYQHAPNLRVLTGKAEYGYPDLAGLLTSPFEGW